MTRNAIAREQVRAGVVECPLCERQIAAPTDHLLVYGAVDSLTAENADALECPACTGVTFVEDGADVAEEPNATDAPD
jgi:hypothetical protein